MQRPAPTNHERVMKQDDFIVSKTDLKGKITYCNEIFMKFANLKRSELINKPHNIIRHPDMPKAAFFKMWETVKGGQVWNGLIKNLRKDGLYYWVETEILPILDDENNITGYIAARKPASRKDINETQEVYKKITPRALYIASEPFVSHGRIELMHYFTEQAISDSYHRYGNLGMRGLLKKTSKNPKGTKDA